jgi:hypothetical protein
MAGASDRGFEGLSVFLAQASVCLAQKGETFPLSRFTHPVNVAGHFQVTTRTSPNPTFVSELLYQPK